jgi:hypothetical protein
MTSRPKTLNAMTSQRAGDLLGKTRHGSPG